MRKFTGLEYIQIDIANQFGMDKKSWDERISWTKKNDSMLEKLQNMASEPILYASAVHALRDAQNSIPTGFIMGLDATASGIQIMAALMGCPVTAYNTNLTTSPNREDVYQTITDEMNTITGHTYDRKEIKHPVMTTFYGSKKQPQELFGEKTEELSAFYDSLERFLPGAMECMEDLQSCWQGEALEHSWTMPDGHVVHIPVMEPVDKKIEVDELNHATFTHRAWVNTPSKKGLSLAANVIHSIDGWMVREMYRRAQDQEFHLLTIHDSFWASPNFMDNVRQNYLDILIEIADSNLLENILREVTGNTSLVLSKTTTTLSKHMTKAEYALS